MMKYLLTLVSLMGFQLSQAQEYRLNYDSSNLPELYNQVTIFLEKKTTDGYQKLKGRYNLQSTDAVVRGNKLSFDRHELHRKQGVISVKAEVNGSQYPLPLMLPVISDIRFNVYTDSIKPVLNYYVNVEGVFSSGRVFPVDTNYITLTADQGTMAGNEWILPKKRDFDKVVFTASCKYDPSLKRSVTLYLKKYNDPRDSDSYPERTEEDVIRGRKRND